MSDSLHQHSIVNPTMFQSINLTGGSEYKIFFLPQKIWHSLQLIFPEPYFFTFKFYLPILLLDNFFSFHK